MDSEPKRILQDPMSRARRGEVLRRIEEVRRGEAVTESYSRLASSEPPLNRLVSLL